MGYVTSKEGGAKKMKGVYIEVGDKGINRGDDYGRTKV